MVIGVTGTSGSGKTVVSNILKEKLACNLVNADEIAKRLAKKGNKYYDEIVECFGQDILDESEEINRRKLASTIYEDEQKREKLNNITNIYVVEEIKKQAFELEEQGIVIIDVPRLIESGLNKICDIVISVLADSDIKLARICRRDNIEKSVAIKRLAIQPEEEFYIENSNYIIENNDETVNEQIDVIVRFIKEGEKHV